METNIQKESKFNWSLKEFKEAAEKLKAFEERANVRFNKDTERWETLTSNN